MRRAGVRFRRCAFGRRRADRRGACRFHTREAEKAGEAVAAGPGRLRKAAPNIKIVQQQGSRTVDDLVLVAPPPKCPASRSV